MIQEDMQIKININSVVGLQKPNIWDITMSMCYSELSKSLILLLFIVLHLVRKPYASAFESPIKWQFFSYSTPNKYYRPVD